MFFTRYVKLVAYTTMMGILLIGSYSIAQSTQRKTATQVTGQPLAATQQRQQFIQKMVNQHQFNAAELNQLFSKVRYQQAIIDAMNRPAEKSKTWEEYRLIFINEKRIKAGKEFFRTHQKSLERAEKKYGVNAEIITAIIGVETGFGANKGRWRVIDALSTLAFHYPRRAEFFTKELEHFLLITRENRANPLTYVGSYAGAMGFPQFMPSSYRNFAIDFDGDGIRDLWNNPVDAIGSVANYLAKNAWVTGGKIAVPVTLKPNANIQSVLHTGSIKKPTAPISRLIKAGVITSVNPQEKALLLRFQNLNNREYWLGYQNFYSITRYNRSPLYALAVYQLGHAIKTGQY